MRNPPLWSAVFAVVFTAVPFCGAGEVVAPVAIDAPVPTVPTPVGSLFSPLVSPAAALSAPSLAPAALASPAAFFGPGATPTLVPGAVPAAAVVLPAPALAPALAPASVPTATPAATPKTAHGASPAEAVAPAEAAAREGAAVPEAGLSGQVQEGRRIFDSDRARGETPEPVFSAPVGEEGSAASRPALKHAKGANAVRRALVLGGGPAGLMSALTFIKNGVPVTLVEQREEYTRPINFGIRQDLIDRIAYVAPALVKPLLAKMSPVESMHLINGVDGTVDAKPVVEYKASYGAKRSDVDPTAMLESPYAGLIRASDLEQVMHDYLAQIERADGGRGGARVRLLEGWTAELRESSPGKYEASLQRVEERVGASGKKERVRVGPAEIVSPDLLVVAEGSNSATRKALGVQSRATSPKTRFIAASLDLPMGGRIRARYHEVADPAGGEPAGVRQILMGNALTKKSWTLTEVPPFLDLKTPEEIKAYYVAQIAPLLELPPEAVAAAKFEWGPNAFDLQQNLSDRMTVGENVVLIGDAVGNAHFSVGGGMMTGTVPHQLALERLLHRLSTSSGSKRVELARYHAEARHASLQWTRLGLRYFGRRRAPEKTEELFNGVVEELDKFQPPLLGVLSGAGMLDEVIAEDLRVGVGTLGAVDTRPRDIYAPAFQERRDLEDLDAQASVLAGAETWANLVAASRRLMDAGDAVGDAARLPPEGIHPVFAVAARPLLEAAQGRSVAPEILRAADAALAAAVESAPDEALPSVAAFLRQNRLRATVARTSLVLRRRLPSLPALVESSVKSLPGLVKSQMRSAADEEDSALAVAIARLSPEQVMLVQDRLAAQGVLDDRLTFFGWQPTRGFARRFPRTLAALSARDPRAELLRSHARSDAAYRAAEEEKRALVARAVDAMLTGAADNDLAAYLADQPEANRRAAAERLIDWALVQRQKLDFLTGEKEAAGAGVPLEKRTVEQTFFDHLRSRREGNLEKDLERNYDPGIVFTSNQGNFFGHEGVRRSAATLARLVPGRDWVMNRLVFVPGPSPREGTAVEVWSTQSPGRQVTAVDNFHIKDGKIVMQSAYYLDPVAGAPGVRDAK